MYITGSDGILRCGHSGQHYDWSLQSFHGRLQDILWRWYFFITLLLVDYFSFPMFNFILWPLGSSKQSLKVGFELVKYNWIILLFFVLTALPMFFKHPSPQNKGSIWEMPDGCLVGWFVSESLCSKVNFSESSS